MANKKEIKVSFVSFRGQIVGEWTPPENGNPLAEVINFEGLTYMLDCVNVSHMTAYYKQVDYLVIETPKAGA